MCYYNTATHTTVLYNCVHYLFITYKPNENDREIIKMFYFNFNTINSL